MAKRPNHAALQRTMAASAKHARPAPAAYTPRPGRVATVGVTGFFEPIVRRQLRTLAVEEDTTIQALLGEALNDLFAKRGKPEVVVRRP